VLALAPAVFAAARMQPRLEFEVQQRGEASVCDEHDVPSIPAVAARGAAPRPVFLAQESHAATAAMAAANFHLDFVDELHGRRGC
jgi:hypothetical protein